MPWKVEKDTKACPVSKPFAVKNSKTGDVNGRCHATRDSAVQQQKLLYAKLGRGEIMASELYLAPISFAEMKTDDKGLVWLEALPAKTWHHPVNGEVPVTKDVLQRMVTNFHENVRGQEIATDYEHRRDPAKGAKASGWYRDMEIRGDSLHVAVEFTEKAKEEIKNKEWKYFSVEWDDWMHPETQQVYQDVVLGGGLTNRPIAKGVMPINFSEIIQEVVSEHADLETMEPGTNAPDPNTNPDDAAEGGWRRETPPAGEDGTITSRPVENKGGEMTLEEELRQLLKLGDDVKPEDIVGSVKSLQSEHKTFSEELEPLRIAAKAAEKKKQFAEDYPEEAKRFTELEERDRRRDAKAFAESLASKRVVRKEGEGDNAKDVSTSLGLSGLAIQTAEEVALKFAEGKGTFDDVKAFAEAVFENGVVDYGSKGSSRTAEVSESDDIPDDMVGVRKMFAEKVAEVLVAQGDKPDRNAAIAKAAEENPKLFEKYQGSSMLKAV